MKISAKISLGFLLLVILVTAVGVVAWLAFTKTGELFRETRRQAPLLLATFRLKEALFDLKALTMDYLREEDEAALEFMSGEFGRLDRRLGVYLEALNRGSESIELGRSEYAEAWEREGFPYSLEPIPPGSPLRSHLWELRALHDVYRVKNQEIQTLWKDSLETGRTVHQLSLAMDEPTGRMEEFMEEASESIRRLIGPIEQMYFLMFRYVAGGVRNVRIQAGIESHFVSVERELRRSTWLSETSIKYLYSGLAAFQGNWNTVAALILRGEPPGEALEELYRSYRVLNEMLYGMQLERWLGRMNTINRERKNYLMASPPADKEKIGHQVESGINVVGRFLEHDLMAIYNEKRVQDMIESQWVPFRSMWQRVVLLDDRRLDLSDRLQEEIRNVGAIEQQMGDLIEDINRSVLDHFEETGNDHEALGARLFRSIYLVTAIALLLAALFGISLSRGIVRSIRPGVTLAQALGRGDFGQKIENERSDEMGMLVKSLNQAAHSLREFHSRISRSVQNIIDSIDTLHRMAGNITKSQDQVTRLVSRFTHETNEQRNNLTKQSGTMESLLNSGQETVRQLMELTETASRSLQEAEDIQENIRLTGASLVRVKEAASSVFQAAALGQETLKEVDLRAGDIRQSTRSISEGLETLGHRSLEIGNITGQIDGMVDEAHILVLNAAIEAARAEETGSGLAAVAQAVRKLADRSHQAAQRAARLIDEMRTEVEKAVQFVEPICEKVDTGSKAVGRAREAIGGIAQTNQAVADETESIATSVTQVAESSRRMARLVGDISECARLAHEATQLNIDSSKQVFDQINTVAVALEKAAALSGEVSAGSQEYQAAGQEMKRAIAETVRLVDALKEDLETFIV